MASIIFGAAEAFYESVFFRTKIYLELLYSRVNTICKILEILKGLSISLKFWLKIYEKLHSCRKGLYN